MKKIDVLMLIRTRSLVYDDRVRKESSTISRSKSLRIIAFENSEHPLDNLFESAEVHRRKLMTRKMFPSNRFVLIKIFEMYVQYACQYLKHKPKYVWLHNIECLGLVYLIKLLRRLFSIKSEIIFDQHEMPPSFFIKNYFGRWLYSGAMKNGTVNILATYERKKYLCSVLGLETNCNFRIVENFPDSVFCEEETKSFSLSVSQWLGSDGFLLAQGGARKDRAFFELCHAAVELKKKVVFVGPYSQKLVNDAKIRLGKEFEEYIFMHQSVPQLRLVDFIERCDAAVIFYKNTSLNNWYAAPNRLYQALSRGKPVIVGNNPVFKIVELLKLGVVAETDGESSCKIKQAITKFYSSYTVSKNNHCKSQWQWSDQEKTVLEIFNEKI